MNAIVYDRIGAPDVFYSKDADRPSCLLVRYCSAKQQLITNTAVAVRSHTLKAVNDKLNRDLEELRELIEAEKVVPIVDGVFSFDEASAALPHLETGQARVKVVGGVS